MIGKCFVCYEENCPLPRTIQAHADAEKAAHEMKRRSELEVNFDRMKKDYLERCAELAKLKAEIEAGTAVFLNGGTWFGLRTKNDTHQAILIRIEEIKN